MKTNKKELIEQAQRLLSGEPEPRQPKVWIIRDGKCRDPAFETDYQPQDFIIEVIRNIHKNNTDAK